jgi:subtilase family serine protease
MHTSQSYSTFSRRTWLAMVGMALLLILAGCGGSSQTTTPTPTVPTLQYTTLNLGIPTAALNSPVVGNLPDSTKMHVGITFKVNQSMLNGMGQQKVKAGQSNDLGSVANQLGISDAQYQQFKTFFGIENATLTLGKLHTYLGVDATAGSFAKLFQTHFVLHRYNGRTFYAPSPAPKLPTLLAGQILAVTGLDNFTPPPHEMFSASQRTALTAEHAQSDCTVDDQAVLPQSIAHSYQYDAFWQHGWHGEGMTINLVEGGAVDQSDIQNYFDCVGFKGKFGTINVGDTPADTANQDASGEATLDIDMIAGLAPNVTILDYQANTDDVQTSSDFWTITNAELQQIIDDNSKNTGAGSIVSISLGQAEPYFTIGDYQAISQSLQILTQAEHMTVFVSSGDCAAFGGGQYNSLAVQFPSTSPYVVSVGGTTLQTDSQGNRTSEQVWSNSNADTGQCQNAWGSGGGNSITVSEPNWQTAPGVKNKYSDGERQVPDVAAVADSVPIYFQGSWQDVGGTSAAAPIWAAGLAMVDEGLIRSTKEFFYGPSTFYLADDYSNGLHPYYDITQGSNLYYPATSGWDYATGLGAPNLVDFYNILFRLITKGQ